MSTRIYLAETGDAERIDQYLSGSSRATVYHRIQWVQAIHHAYGYHFSYYVAENDGEVAGVLPVCHFRTMTGKKILCSLPFCDVGGIVADNDEIYNRLFEEVKSSIELHDINRVELRERSEGVKSGPELMGRKVRMLLDLPEDSETLMAGFKSKLRSQIRKAEKNGLRFDYENDESSIDDFFSVFSRNMHMLGSPVHSIKWFYALRESYREDLVVGRVWCDDTVVGAGILLFCGDKVSIPWASTLREYNRLAPNMLLYWGLLSLSCDRGCSLFDFGRSTYGEGTFNFKKQWGARPALLDWKTYDGSGSLIESTVHDTDAGHKYARDMVVWSWKKLPLPIVNRLGPLLRRHISL